jgi:hypothetical protein
MRHAIYKIGLAICFLFALKAKAQSIDISVKANNDKEVNIYHNEPVLLTVTISNREAQENSRWNKATERRLKELESLLKENKISREAYDQERNKLIGGKRPVTSSTMGAAGSPWSSLLKWKMVHTSSGAEVGLKLRTMMNPSTEEMAVLDETGFYMAYFGMDAVETGNIPAGVYIITVGIANEMSLPVKMTIKSESIPAPVLNTEAMLLQNGQYWWHAGNAAEGMAYADKILQKNPSSLDGLSLKGDLQVLNNAYHPALESYNKALKEYYKQNAAGAEPPGYLMEMIAWVKKQLGQ